VNDRRAKEEAKRKEEEDRQADERYRVADHWSGDIYARSNPFTPSVSNEVPLSVINEVSRAARKRLLGKLRSRLFAAQEQANTDRSFLQDIAVLVQMAEPMLPNDPVRLAIIGSLREQLKGYDVDVDAHFQAYDRAHGRLVEKPDPFAENQKRIGMEEEAERNRREKALALLTPKEREICDLFGERIRRGDLLPHSGPPPGGTYPNNCAIVVKEALKEEAQAEIQEFSPKFRTGQPEGAATKTAREIIEGK
jgi:hypothetical protein